MYWNAYTESKKKTLLLAVLWFRIRILIRKDPHPHQIKIRIRIRFRIKIHKLDPESDPDPHQFANVRPKCMEYEPILALFFQGVEPFCEAMIWIRIRIRIRLKSRIRIHIKVMLIHKTDTCINFSLSL
jgi:hypothetical protein